LTNEVNNDVHLSPELAVSMIAALAALAALWQVYVAKQGLSKSRRVAKK
jgi:hypothetical protein